MDALQNNDEKTHLIKRTSTEAKLMGFASVFMCARQEHNYSTSHKSGHPLQQVYNRHRR